LNFTTLLAAVVEKFVPVITTVPPTATVEGLKPVNVGVGTTETLEEVRVKPAYSTVTEPVVAPTGIVIVKEVAVKSLTVAVKPLNFTTMSEADAGKLVPVTVTVPPTTTVEGETEDKVGAATTV
jgi:uncharacterized protein (DUF1499 family)